MFEQEKKAWLDDFKRNLFPLLHNPTDMIKAIVDREALRVGGAAYKSPLLEHAHQKDAKVYESTATIREGFQRALFYLDNRTPDEKGNFYELDERAFHGLEKMGFTQVDIEQMRPSEVLQYASAVGTTIQNIVLAKIEPAYTKITKASTGVSDTLIQGAIRDQKAFLDELYLAAKPIIEKALKKQRQEDQKPTKQQELAYNAVREALRRDVDASVRESVEAIIEQVDSLKNRQCLSVDDLLEVLRVTEVAIHNPEGIPQLITQKNYIEKFDKTTALLLSSLHDDILIINNTASKTTAAKQLLLEGRNPSPESSDKKTDAPSTPGASA